MLYRVKNSKYAMLGGICAGISHRTNIALWVVRVLFLICACLQPPFILIYFLLWAFLPIKHMTDQQFKVESITFKDIPSVKIDAVVEEKEKEKVLIDSPKVVVKNIEKKIEEQIEKNK